MVEWRQSSLEENLPTIINVMQTKYPHKDEYAVTISAFNAQPQIMSTLAQETVSSKRINPYKQYGLLHRYQNMLSVEARADAIYENSDESVLNKLEAEKGILKNSQKIWEK